MTLSADIFGLPSMDTLELLRAIRRVEKVTANRYGHWRDEDLVWAWSLVMEVIESLSKRHGRRAVVREVGKCKLLIKNEMKNLTNKPERKDS